MSAHLCLPRQLPCSFPVEIVELPLTPPHAWYVHAKNRGKLISPTWNLFIKLSQFLVCRGNRLTGRGRMKTQGRWHFIDIICTKSCYNANAYSSPLFFSFFVSPRITLVGQCILFLQCWESLVHASLCLDMAPSLTHRQNDSPQN